MRALFFARDPGAADVVAEVYARFPHEKVFFAKDRARQHLDRKGISFQDFNALGFPERCDESHVEMLRKFLEMNRSASVLVTGTTHRDDMTDRILWELAPEFSITTVALNDQWFRVKERFEVDGKRYRPDIIFSPGREPQELIEKHGLARRESLRYGQPFLYRTYQEALGWQGDGSEERERLSAHFGEKIERLILYVSEPQSKLADLGAQYEDIKHDEFDIYRELSSSLREVERPGDFLLAKLHPKEEAEGFERMNVPFVQHEFDKQILLRAANLVVGAKSMLMLEALFYRARVVSIDYWALEHEQLISFFLGLSERVCSREELRFSLEDDTFQAPNCERVAEKLGVASDWYPPVEDSLLKLMET